MPCSWAGDSKHVRAQEHAAEPLHPLTLEAASSKQGSFSFLQKRTQDSLSSCAQEVLPGQGGTLHTNSEQLKPSRTESNHESLGSSAPLALCAHRDRPPPRSEHPSGPLPPPSACRALLQPGVPQDCCRMQPPSTLPSNTSFLPIPSRILRYEWPYHTPQRLLCPV